MNNSPNVDATKRDSANITDIQIKNYNYSETYQPFQLRFKRNNQQLNWDIIKVNNRIDVCIFNTDTKKLVLVKKFYPGTYLMNTFGKKQPDEKINLKKYPPELGLTYDLCSGFIGKNQSVEDTVKNVVEKYTGHKIPENSIQKVITYCLDTSPSGNQTTYFYCEINISMKVTENKIYSNTTSDEELSELSIQEARDLTIGESTINTTDNC